VALVHQLSYSLWLPPPRWLGAAVVVERSVGDCSPPPTDDIVIGFDLTSWSAKGYSSVECSWLVGVDHLIDSCDTLVMGSSLSH
jgi:hypothetical protein